MSKTLKITLVVAVVVVAAAASFLVGQKTSKINLERLGTCLQPASGTVVVKDSSGADQKVLVVVASQIAECINKN